MHTFYENPPIEAFDNFVENIGDDMDFIHKAAEGLPLYGNRAIRMLRKLVSCSNWNKLNSNQIACLKHYLNLVPSIWGIDCTVNVGHEMIYVTLQGNGSLCLSIGSYFVNYVFHDKNGFGEGGLNLEVTYNIMLGEMLDKIRETV